MTRRWVNEAMVLEEMERLNDISMDLVREFKGQAVAAADAEATHKALRAKRVLLAQANGQGATGRAMSIAAAEYTAEADPEVSEAYRERLITDAIRESTREAMRSIRTNQDALRTAAASHRSPISGPGF